MLNEFLEFESYVTNPTSPTPRVQPYLLTDHFSESANLIGIEHIMTVIARAFLFSEEKIIQDDVISQQVVEDTIELLHRWTGFADTESRKRTQNERVDAWMKKNSIEDAWLKKFWMFHFSKGKMEPGLWEKVEKEWSRKFNSPLDYVANVSTYNNVIANAFEIGPLKNHYFIVKKDLSQTDAPVKENKRFKYLTDKSGRQETTDMKIMKIIAAYLLHLKDHPEGQTEVWLRNGELANWYGLDDGKNGSETFYPKDVTWKGKPIFTRRSLRGRFTKVVVDQEYLEEFDFKIIDIEDADRYKETHWVLEDMGHKLEGCWGIK